MKGIKNRYSQRRIIQVNSSVTLSQTNFNFYSTFFEICFPSDFDMTCLLNISSLNFFFLFIFFFLWGWGGGEEEGYQFVKYKCQLSLSIISKYQIPDQWLTVNTFDDSHAWRLRSRNPLHSVTVLWLNQINILLSSPLSYF